MLVYGVWRDAYHVHGNCKRLENGFWWLRRGGGWLYIISAPGSPSL